MLLISPHLDDAALSCASRLARGDIIQVVTVFAGLPDPDAPLSDWDQLTRATSARSRMIERRAEDRAAWESVGQAFSQLDLREGSADAFDHVALRDAIRQLAATYDRVLLPGGIGRHPDHCLVRDLGLEVLQGTKEISLYGELPYAAFFGWPGDDPHLDVEAYWRSDLPSGIQIGNPVITPLNERERAWKRALLHHYPSQMAAVGGGSLRLFERTGLLDHELEFPVMS